MVMLKSRKINKNVWSFNAYALDNFHVQDWPTFDWFLNSKQVFTPEELFVWYDVHVHEGHWNIAQWLKRWKAIVRFTFRLIPWQHFDCFSICLSLQSQFGERKRVLGMNARSNKQINNHWIPNIQTLHWFYCGALKSLLRISVNHFFLFQEFTFG